MTVDLESRTSLSPRERPGRSFAAILALVTVLYFVAGVLLVLITAAVEQAGIEGAGWSLRGNGALIVPICGTPLLIVAGWAALLFSLRRDMRLGLGGLAAGTGVLLLAILLSYLVARFVLPVILLAALAAAVLFARRSDWRRAFGRSLAGALLMPAALAAGFYIAVSFLLPQ